MVNDLFGALRLAYHHIVADDDVNELLHAAVADGG